MKRGYGSSPSTVDPQALTPPPAGPGPGAATPAHRPRWVHATAMSDPTTPEPDQGDVVPEQPDLEQQDRDRREQLEQQERDRRDREQQQADEQQQQRDSS